MNEKKYKSVVAIWGVIFLTLQALALISAINLFSENYSYLKVLMVSFVAVIMVALVIIFMVLSFKKKKAGPIVGMIFGAVYIITSNGINIVQSFIVNFIAGVCFIVSCIGMLRYIEKCKTEIVEKQKIEEQKDNIEN